MALKVSTAFKNAVLDTESVKETFDGGFITVYSGDVPATADAALGSATALVTYTESGGATGLTLAAAAEDGVISKEPTEMWQGEAVASGNASFFRYWQTGDTGALATDELRLQGTVGIAGADMTVPTVAFVDETVYVLNFFSLPLLGRGD